MLRERRFSKKICLGGVEIGGNAPISVQSMTKTDTRDVNMTVKQINDLQEVGCDIVRIAVPDIEAALCFEAIKEKTNLPLIADIHFDYRLALECIEKGADGIRLNPGNIPSASKISLIIQKAKEKNIPVRIGVNAGSLEKKIKEKYKDITPHAMVESTLNYIEFFEKEKYTNLKISLKASNIKLMYESYRLLAAEVDYPFHIGVTEAGAFVGGIVKSSIGIGTLLKEGLGDTIRVSLTDKPENEVIVGHHILRTLGLRNKGVDLISCPTCGRCEVNLQEMVLEVEKKVRKIHAPLTIAIMGCVVNGPGEASEADFGIAGGKERGVVFSKGKKVKIVSESKLVDELMNEIVKHLNCQEGGRKDESF